MSETYYYGHIVQKAKIHVTTLQYTWERIAELRVTKTHVKCTIQSVLEHTQRVLNKNFELMEKALKKADEQKDRSANNEYLRGLWDMFEIEIEELQRRYDDLHTRLENGWRKPTDPTKQTSSKPHETKPVPTQRDLVPTNSPPTHSERSFISSLSKNASSRSTQSTYTQSIPTKTPSTGASSSTKVYSAPTSNMNRSKAPVKKPFKHWNKKRSQSVAGADDSGAEFFDRGPFH